MSKKPFLEIMTPLGVLVRTTAAHWGRIVALNHPVMRGKEDLVKKALSNPFEIRRSRRDEAVYLYYSQDLPYYTCVVVRHLNGEGFIITAYRTEGIKDGERVWPQ